MITQNIIGFALSGKSGRKIYSYNPTTQKNDVTGFDVATPDEVNACLDKATAAWRIYRNTPGTEKAAFLRRVAEGIEGLKDEFVTTIAEETGYPAARIITERNRTCAQLRMFAELVAEEKWREITVDEALPERSPVPRPKLQRMLIPIGPVVVFGASNFPLAYSTMGGDAVSALAVGCPVIIKAHESHLRTNALVAEVVLHAARETNMPDGVFSSLHGDGLETGRLLVTHPLTAAVGFTGSFRGGKALFDLGVSREKPIPVFAEMGSVNPIFIFPSAMYIKQSEIIPSLINSMTLTVGQFCTNPGILVLQKNEHTNAFIENLKSELEKIPAAVMLNNNIAKSFHQGINALGENKQVEFLTHSKSIDQEAAPVLAKVSAEHFLSNAKLHEEIFGPYSLIVECSDFSECMAVAGLLEGQLTASIFFEPEDHNQAQQLTEVLTEKAGRLIFNGVPTGVEVCASMTHGGPFPATTDNRFTAVGQYSFRRWVRPITYQNADAQVLPFPLNT